MSQRHAVGKMTKASSVIPWIALVISVCSLVLSYFTSLSASNIVVDVSAPQWVMRHIQLGNITNQIPTSIAVKLTCAFSNKGARTGVVNDLLLKLESLDDLTRWLFYPGIQVDDTKFLEADPKGIMSSVYPVTVAGKQSQVSTYLFIPMLQHPNFPYGEIRPHKFRATVLMRTNGDHDWKPQQVFVVDFSQQIIDQIKTGMVLQQFPDELDQLRRDVK
jgi:hypothetical protein